MLSFPRLCHSRTSVIPAKAGIQFLGKMMNNEIRMKESRTNDQVPRKMDSCVRSNDMMGNSTCIKRLANPARKLTLYIPQNDHPNIRIARKYPLPENRVAHQSLVFATGSSFGFCCSALYTSFFQYFHQLPAGCGISHIRILLFADNHS